MTPPWDPPTWSVVVPTIGRPTLGSLVGTLLDGLGLPGGPRHVVVVDDRRWATPALGLPAGASVVATGGRGPAAARNAGWRAAVSEWVVFVDDDVVVGDGWRPALLADLSRAGGDVAGIQGRIRVPMPTGRRPTDWERNTAGLETACWATADMAYRREVLAEVGGFDERFPRAFREDADLGLRVSAAGYLIVAGEREVTHPVRVAGAAASLRVQAGNADDVLMGALHGPGWRQRCGAEVGRNGRHRLTVAAAGVAAAAALGGRRRVAAAAAAGWAAGTAELAYARIAPGPRDRVEVGRMVATSLVMPFVAVAHGLRGRVALPGLVADSERAPLGVGLGCLRPRSAEVTRPGRADPAWEPAAILFDRDGTLVIDVPYNHDPARVALMPGAKVALERARRAGLKVGVVTNQSGVGRGRIAGDQLVAVNRRIEELLGPFDAWAVCPHQATDGCACRKPAPGLVRAAAADLGVEPSACAVVGDIGSDIAAARRAGARSILVPTRATLDGEVREAPVVAPDLIRAVDYVLAGTC